MTGPSSNPSGERAPLRGELPPATLLAPSEPVPPSATEERHGGRRLRPRVDQLTDDQLDQLYATIQRLNRRAQEAESKVASYQRAVAQWDVSERGTYIPHASLAAIGRVAGTDILGSVRHLRHFTRVEQAEAAIARVRAVHAPGRDWSWKPFGCEHHGAHAQPCAHCGVCSPCPTLTALDTTA